MKLAQLIKNISYEEIIGSIDVEIENISQDSRDINFKNGLYFAVPGTQIDGHYFIADVIEKGVVAIVCEKLPDIIHNNITYIVVTHIKKVVGEIANVFHEKPSEQIKIIAVTGTNGKTTIVNYMSQSLQMLGEKVLLLSTAGDYFNGQKITIHRKAPSSLETIELHRIMRFYLDKGATHVCLEATSQGLDQQRLSGIDIDIAIFTNLEQDHLDYHITTEHYKLSKKLLFDNLKDSAIAISNYDDSFGREIVSDSKAYIFSYGIQGTFDYSYTVNKVTLGFMDVMFNQNLISLPIIGMFNVYNVISIYAALVELKYDISSVKKVLEQLQGVPGRMQQIENDHDILAIVDYAHSPGALESVLKTLGEIPHNNIITIVGCGGDRDRTKRAPMAHIAQRLSDRVFFTADNPRTEELAQIFSDMKKDLDDNVNNYEFISSREESIQKAVTTAQPKDIILIAGKGHEDYQIIGTKKYHFDDTEVMQKYLNEKN